MDLKSVHHVFHILFTHATDTLSYTSILDLMENDQEQAVLTELRNSNLLETKNELFRIPLENRIPLLELGLRLGGDLERLASYLTWQEFEAFCKTITVANRFRSYVNVRFTTVWNKKRYEIDVLAFKRPYILGIDAKHWQIHTGSAAALRNALKSQYTRLENLVQVLPDKIIDFQINQWGEATVYPIIVSLFDQNIKIQPHGVIVPVFKLNSFLLGFEANLDLLPFIQVKLPTIKNLTEYY